MLFVNLIQCPNCGNQYSAENDACTHCYAPRVGTIAIIPADAYKTGDHVNIEYEIDTYLPIDKPKRNYRLNIFVPSNPIPKGRPRFNGKTKKTYTPEATETYKELVQHYAAIAIAQQDYTMPDKDMPLMIVLHFNRADKRGADTDNLQKAIMDALNKVAFLDDKQILASIVTVQRGIKHSAGAWVEIRPYYPDLSILENLEALNETE